MSGGYRGTVLLRGVCPVCGREVSGGNCESGMARGSRIMLRNHTNEATRQRCDGSRGVVSTDYERTAAWAQRKRLAADAAWAAWKAKLSEPVNPAGCPQCGSDDYEVLDVNADGEPDYGGLKRCDECGEEWT